MEEKIWLAIGFTGQIFFFLRFLVQWIVSEKAGRSIIPMAFWYLSIVGTLIVFSYAIYRKDPVFIVAYSFNTIVYLRNIALVKKSKTEVS